MSKKSEFKAALIVYRTDSPEALSFAKKTVQWLKKTKTLVYSPQKIPATSTLILKTETDWKKINLVIVLGGDGTYLEAVRLLNGRDIPVVGSNFGRVGFLTSTSSDNLFRVIEKFWKDKNQITSRNLIEVKVEKKGKVVFEDLSLNDIVVERGGNTHLIDLSLHCDGYLVSRLRSDGLIVASATGSTAYNLSAGGPIIHPEVDALVVTPVCPHSLTARPILLADHHTISIHLNQNQKALLMIDGQPGLELNKEHKVIIKKSKKSHRMVVSKKIDFFELLNNKLDFGHRG